MQSWVSKKSTGLNSIGPINPSPLTLDQYTIVIYPSELW